MRITNPLIGLRDCKSRRAKKREKMLTNLINGNTILNYLLFELLIGGFVIRTATKPTSNYTALQKIPLSPGLVHTHNLDQKLNRKDY